MPFLHCLPFFVLEYWLQGKRMLLAVLAGGFALLIKDLYLVLMLFRGCLGDRLRLVDWWSMYVYVSIKLCLDPLLHTHDIHTSILKILSSIHCRIISNHFYNVSTQSQRRLCSTGWCQSTPELPLLPQCQPWMGWTGAVRKFCHNSVEANQGVFHTYSFPTATRHAVHVNRIYRIGISLVSASQQEPAPVLPVANQHIDSRSTYGTLVQKLLFSHLLKSTNQI